jgi:co-chaperonin GroES (HSP10)
MKKGKKELLVVGDRVLIRVEDGEERTKVGLYLPATAMEGQQVQGGTIVATGPGQPLPVVEDHLDEPWRITSGSQTKHVPMQAQVGDYALFFRKAAVEITFDDERFLVVPQAAILTLAR